MSDNYELLTNTERFADWSAALDIAKRSIDDESITDTLEGEALDRAKLLIHAPWYIEIQKDLIKYDDIRRHRRLDDQEWDDYKTNLLPMVIEFNQRLADYAYLHPNERMNDIHEALVTSALRGGESKGSIEHHMTDTLRGARTEAVTRQLFDLAHIPYTPGSIESDRRGGDLLVHHHGHDIKIDIKSSLSSIAEARGGYDVVQEQNLQYAIYKRPGEERADNVVRIYAGFEDEDLEALGDTLGIDPNSEFAQDHSLQLALQIKKAIAELGIQ